MEVDLSVQEENRRVRNEGRGNQIYENKHGAGKNLQQAGKLKRKLENRVRYGAGWGWF